MNRKNADLKMGLLMGGTMSFVLSLTGLLSSGKFTFTAFAKNFVAT
ncbi:MAG: hypothetical protein IIZ28_02190 [Erysipelotrichaceae bacterium]|nr:hypothetical protein [Erysipelotrichaceae bacterium]